MDARVEPLPKPRFLPALAEQLALWFPEVGGRALAVSEVSITKENVPTLPIVMTAFIRGTADPPLNADTFEMIDTFIVDFWLEPARYKKANGSETPFWSFYDYEKIRDTLLSNIVRWETPGGERISFRELKIEAEPFAVTLTFRFTATFRWCPDKLDHGEPFSVGFNLCTASDCCVPGGGRSVPVTTRFNSPPQRRPDMALIYVKAKEGRKAFYEGRIIPADKFIAVTDDPYIRRLVDHWGDLEVQGGDKKVSAPKAALKPPAPAPGAPITSAPKPN